MTRELANPTRIIIGDMGSGGNDLRVCVDSWDDTLYPRASFRRRFRSYRKARAYVDTLIARGAEVDTSYHSMMPYEWIDQQADQEDSTR